MAFVHDKAVTGSCTRNPFKFHHLGLNHLCLNVGGDQIPRVPLEPNFAQQDYLPEYVSVLEALGYDIGPNCWDIKPSELANGYNIYVVKITPGPLAVVKSLSRARRIRLESKFTQPTTHNITAIFLAEERRS